MSFDHIVAEAAGGHTVPENMAPACRTCNFSKGKKSALSFIAYLKSKGRKVHPQNSVRAMAMERSYRVTYSSFTEEEIETIKRPVVSTTAQRSVLVVLAFSVVSFGRSCSFVDGS